MKRHVVVVGGGVTGLAALHALTRQGISATLVEREGRFGGNIRTERRDGFVIDAGPDSWVAAKPEATALAKELGLESSIVGTNPKTRRVYIAHGRSLHPVPEGFVLGIPTELLPLATSGLFSFSGKLRMIAEPFVTKKAWEDEGDESIGTFVTRRLGAEANDRLAGPLLGGIFAGEADTLSVRATFPQFVEAEKKHGSLVRSMKQLKRLREKGGGEKSAFLSLRGGLSELVDALARSNEKGATLLLGKEVVSVSRSGAGFEVRLSEGHALSATDVMIAAPAHHAARLCRESFGEVADLLAGVEYVSTATVFFGFKRADVAHPLDAVGFLVPRSLGRPLLACTWVSSKWDARAPEGHVLMRAFFGGASGQEMLLQDDDGLIRTARTELEELMGLSAEPLFARVFRFDRASPQPKVGHLLGMSRLTEALKREPGLRVLGSGLFGFGIPDCIKQANRAVEELMCTV